MLAVGASCYGLSLRFYLLAQRAFGAARTGSVFAFALGERSVGWGMAAGGVLMLIGVLIHLVDTHAHEHLHDDGHLNHSHDPVPEGAHSHLHRHAALRHS